MILGVTVGKFYPFHKGHDYLIREAKKKGVAGLRYDRDQSRVTKKHQPIIKINGMS